MEINGKLSSTKTRRLRRSARHDLHEAVSELNVVGIRQGKESQKIRRRHIALNEAVEKLLADGMQPIGKLANDLGKLGSHTNESPEIFFILGSQPANSKACYISRDALS